MVRALRSSLLALLALPLASPFGAPARPRAARARRAAAARDGGDDGSDDAFERGLAVLRERRAALRASELPLVLIDPLLPRQRLEFSTSDPAFGAILTRW